MNQARHKTIVVAFAISLLFFGLLRYSGFSDNPLTPFSGYATVLYILATVIAAVLLIRGGLELNHLGFGFRLRLQHVGLAVGAVVVIRLVALGLDPALEALFGEGRNLERFSDVRGSLAALFTTLVFSWTFAAFGEEIAFRIVLLRGLWSLLGDTRSAAVIAVVVQALIFGLVHVYQGPAGIVSSTVSGLVYGTITVMARGAIWPAAVAHGANNTIGLLLLYSAADT